jgi:uncharacterized protein involved in tolerance to divalent cations
MNQKYLQVSISAESREQVDAILNSLLEKKLVTGGQIINAPARFLWKGKIEDMDYFTIKSYTLASNKQAIISETKNISIEEIPMIHFIEIDGNQELLSYIDQSFSS